MRLYSLDARQNPHLPFRNAKRKRGQGENTTISLTGTPLGHTGCGNLGWHDFSLTTCGRIVQTLSGGVCPATSWRAKAQRRGLDHQPGTQPNRSICWAF
jgi:hypothetical protein